MNAPDKGAQRIMCSCSNASRCRCVNRVIVAAKQHLVGLRALLYKLCRGVAGEGLEVEALHSALLQVRLAVLARPEVGVPDSRRAREICLRTYPRSGRDQHHAGFPNLDDPKQIITKSIAEHYTGSVNLVVDMPLAPSAVGEMARLALHLSYD